MLAGIKAVYFDAVGTLLHPEPPAIAVYAEVARSQGSRLALPFIAERFQAAFAREEALDRAADYRTSEARELCRWRRIVAEVLDDVADPEACFQELYLHFGRPGAWRCDPQVESLLERLAQRGMLLGIASNFDHRLRPVLAGKQELRLLRGLVLSSEVGWRKPAPEFFAALVAAAGVPASAILYVGDDPHNDYQGAEKAGMRAVLLDRGGRQAAQDSRRIEQLLELEDLAM